jgi:transcriptional regulator with XRE-family HTH domain
MSTLREQVGHAIRHQRKLKSWSQEELAARTGRSIEMINRVERGRIAPSFETLEVLAGAFGIPVRDLFGIGDHDAKPDRDDGLVRLIGRVAGLNPEDVEWVDQLVGVALSRKVRPSSRAAD